MDARSIGGMSARASLATRNAQETELAGLSSGARRASPAEAAKKFEALFATQLVKEMRSSLSEGFFGEGPQADVYSGWLDQFVGDAIAKDGGLHLADGLQRTLERARAAEDAAKTREGAR